MGQYQVFNVFDEIINPDKLHAIMNKQGKHLFKSECIHIASYTISESKEIHFELHADKINNLYTPLFRIYTTKNGKTIDDDIFTESIEEAINTFKHQTEETSKRIS